MKRLKIFLALALMQLLAFSFSVLAQNAIDVAAKKPDTTMPAYPGGEKALVKLLQDNIKYPQAPLKKGIEGKVIVWFDITAEGKVENIRVPESVDKDLDAEAIRVARLMKNWQPASSNGKPIKAVYKLPVTFKITDKAPNQKQN